MSGKASFLDSIDDVRLRALHDYWDALRGPRIAPAYAEVDPLDMPRAVLPCILIAEVFRDAGRRRYRFRLCGTEVEGTYGRRMGGYCVDELSSGDYRDYMVGLYDRLVETRLPILSVSAYHGRSIHTERLMLPLSSDGEQVDKVLAAQTFSFRRELPRVILPAEGAFDAVTLLQPEPAA